MGCICSYLGRVRRARLFAGVRVNQVPGWPGGSIDFHVIIAM